MNGFCDTAQNLLFLVDFFFHRLSTSDKREQLSAVTHTSVVLKVFL